MPTSDEEHRDSSLGLTDPLGVTRRSFLLASSLAATGLGSASATPPPSVKSCKRGPSFYTPDHRTAARWNIDSYDWAQTLCTETVEQADEILSVFGLEDLWSYVGSQLIPRAAWLAPPVQTLPAGSGDWELTELVGTSSFVATPETRWTVTNGAYTLPTNDFEAYRQSGLDAKGTFDPERADEALLVNERHPEMGPTWGVDDGLGWVDENGDLGKAGVRWVPVAYAHHWAVVYGCRSMLQTLSRAYLFTKDQRYARAATVLLDRIADVYPSFSLQETPYFDAGYTEVNGFTNPSHGGTGRGKQLGSIWESYWIKAVLRAYDAVYPAQASDEALVSFCADRAETYPAIGPKASVAAIRHNIESNLVQEVVPAVKNAQIRGNIGSHQATLALAAVVQDDPDGFTNEAIEFLLQSGGLEQLDTEGEWGHWRVSGGDLRDTIVESFDRDGFPDEGSIHYNSLVKEAVTTVTDVLERTDVEPPAQWQLERMLETEPALSFDGTYVPSIGDTKRAGRPGIDELVGVDALVSGCADTCSNTCSRTLGKWLYERNGESTDGLRESVFEWNPDSVTHFVEQLLAAEGPLDQKSTQLAGFGFTGLRSSTDSDNAVWTYYGRNAYEIDGSGGSTHCHHDTLNLGVFAHGLDCTPDLGYPEQTGKWPKRMHWTRNTISHNTVVVDDRTQNDEWVGIPRQFEHTDRVQLFEVGAPDHYDVTDQYRRTTAQIMVDESDAYVVDFFRVDGGNEHVFSFHGAQTIDEHSQVDDELVVTVRDGDGTVTTSQTRDSVGIDVTSPSARSADWAGIVLEERQAEQIEVTVRPVLSDSTVAYNQSVYLGTSADGRHVCAGVGGVDGDCLRVGLFYPDSDEWVDCRLVTLGNDGGDDTNGEKRASTVRESRATARDGLEMTVENDADAVSITVERDDRTIASHTVALESFTPSAVGVFGAIGTEQIGRLRYESVVVDGHPTVPRETDTPTGVSTSGLDLVSQSSGTYAGTSVEKPAAGETTTYDTVVGNGYNYLYNVRRDSDPQTPCSVEWVLSDYWNVHEDYQSTGPVRLRLTQLEPLSSIALANGDPPHAWGNPDTFTYMLARRSGTDISSTLTSVIEPYTERFVESIQRLPIDSPDPTARAVEIQLSNGRTDYVLSAATHDQHHTVTDRFSVTGAFCVVSECENELTFASLTDGTALLRPDGSPLLTLPAGRIEGTVLDFTRVPSDRYCLEIELDQPYSELFDRFELAGRWVYADSIPDRNGAYEIQDVVRHTDDQLVLDLGTTPTIDRPTEDGYQPILVADGKAVIPLTAQYRA